MSRLPAVEGDKLKRQKFKHHPIGFFHINIAEVQTAERKLFLFVGIERTAKSAVTQLVETADRRTAWGFLQKMRGRAVLDPHHPYRAAIGPPSVQARWRRHAVRRAAPQPEHYYSRPMHFDMICEANGSSHADKAQ